MYLWFVPFPQCQGPFSTLAMLRWLEAGYFDASRPLRRDDEKGFTPLHDGSRIKRAARDIVLSARSHRHVRRAIKERHRQIICLIGNTECMLGLYCRAAKVFWADLMELNEGFCFVVPQRASIEALEYSRST